MGDEIWSEGAITIVLLPSDKQGEDLLDLAREWTQHGIISPAMWVSPAGVTLVETGPPEVRATLIASDRQSNLIEGDVSVFDVLAVETLRIVRLVKVRSALPDRASDAAQDSIAESLSRYIAAAMPRGGPPASAGGERLELLRITLICAPTEFRMTERVNAEVRDATTLVVASPEDRATPLSGDAFVRDNERFQGFVLMHTATIGGLWAGLPVGSFEVLEREASLSHAIWIPRVFASGVLTGGLSQRIAAVVLIEVSDRGVTVGGAPVIAAGTSLIPTDQVPAYVDRMLQAGMELDGRALELHQPDVPPEPEKKRVSILRQWWHFILFSADKFARIPYWIAVWGHDSAARKTNKRFQGEEGKFSVEIIGDGALDARDRAMVDTAKRAAQLDDGVRTMLGGTPNPTTRRATPRLWSGLRQLVFGTLDGGEGVRDVFPPIENRIPVFGDPDSVVPDPSDEWRYPGAAPAGFPERVDWRAARAEPPLHDILITDIEERTASVAVAQEKLIQEQARHSEAVTALEDRTREFIDLGLLIYRADGRLAPGRRSIDDNANSNSAEATDVESPEPPQPTPQEAMAERRHLERLVTSLTNVVAVADAALTSAQAGFEAAEVALASYEEWRSRLAGSFGWRILDRVDETIVRGRQDLDDAENVKAEVPEAGELVRLRKRFHRGLIGATLGLGTATALAMVLPLIVQWLIGLAGLPKWLEWIVNVVAGAVLQQYYPSWWQILLAGGGGLIVTILALCTAYYLGWSRFERRAELAMYRLDWAATRIASLRVELERLRAQREQLVEWIHILASAIHRPWVVPPEILDNGSSGLDVSRLPFALHIATAIDGPGTGADRLREAAAEAFLKPGWRSASFELLLDEVRHRLGQSRSQFGVDALDSDLPDASNGSRLRLQAHIGDEQILEQVAKRLIGDLADKVQDRDIYEADIAVRPIRADPLAAFRRDGRESDTTWKPFLTETLGTRLDLPSPLSPLGIAQQELQEAYHESVTTYVLAPQRIATDLQAEARAETIIRAYPPDAASALDVVVRIDIVGPVPISAIGLWSGVESTDPGYRLASGVLKCPNCGRATCPAADPNSELVCDAVGI